MKFDKYEKQGAYHWDWYDDPNWAWYKECVDRCVEFCKGSTIDAGCGDGLVASKLMFEKHRFTLGVDNDIAGLNICISQGIPVLKADLNKMFSVGVKFDYLCSLNTLEHLSSPDGLMYLITNYVTKGAIIITDKATEHKGRYHEHEYTKKELLDLFKEFKPKYFEINSTEHGKPITFHGVEIYK